MARLSLVALALSMLSGCLVDDPPPFIAPQQTPPRLDTKNGFPLQGQFIETKQGEVITFRMPVTSEDAGDDLSAVLLFDYTGDSLGAEQLNSGHLSASTLADTNPRVFVLPWMVRKGIDAGCHLITLRVTHFGNTGSTGTAVLDKDDLAETSWFANINVTAENANSLVKCPSGSAGSDSP